MATCANQYLALSISPPPSQSDISNNTAPTPSISLYLDPIQRTINTYSNLPKSFINLSSTPFLSNTTLSETLTSDIYTLNSIAFVKPTFQTYIIPSKSDKLRGELVYYFSGNNKNTQGYYVIVPVYYSINGLIDFSKITNISQLFPNLMEYVQYPYCNNNINFFVIYLYNGIDLFVNLQTIPYNNDINQNTRNLNNLFTFYKNISPATKPALNTTKQFTCTDLNTSKDIQGNYVVVDPSNGKRLDTTLSEATAAQAAALNLNGKTAIEIMFEKLMIFIGIIVGLLIIIYLWRWIHGDLSLAAITKSIVGSGSGSSSGSSTT